ncbi:PhzF family phenazine biosynthesis isomerase [Actinomadura barringtoniae]|uniref:PhzF family phenazine biosynthesis isomerase n=1 Tax=Actinomadura barringtoniae TaxID=1427535 RepID=A0A939TDN7_9ACTN|nr:PhzF family phenazine biosynthesis isomerase [Actinomadura barringtoniae]MBO2455797.1 PhzF family phenazine biosynthesis isomerase [Actinomadura barringtoniae]
MKMLVVDAFTDRPFAGNPAGVCLLERPADPAWMQRVAAEMRHSETAFVRPIEGPDADYELRWFTPVIEVALCGHATLAGAHALYGTGAVPADRPIRFQTLRSGVLTVTREADGGLVMDFPANPPAEVQPPDDLGEALRTTPFWTGRTAQNDLFVLVADEEAVRKLEPDNAILSGVEARGVIVTAKADPGQEHDFVSRFFGGGLLLGDGEDPVTGSAHCALGPYWGQELGKDVLTGFQASERGGTVGVTLRGDRVILTGRAVTVLEGEFTA